MRVQVETNRDGAFERRRRDEGASAVEFALVLPFLLMLVFGMLTGGLALNQKLGVEQANREAARWAATLPLQDGATDEDGVLCPGPSGAPEKPDDCWFANVARNAVFSANGELDVEGRNICVAYIHEFDHDGDSTTPLINHSKSLRWEGVDGQIVAENHTTPGTACFPDDPSLGTNTARVQVQVARPGWFNLIFFSRHFTMESSSVAIFEPPLPYE